MHRIIAFLIIFLWVSPLIGGALENQLRAKWQGRWVILTAETYSNCNGFYSNNQVNQGLVTSKAKRLFQMGELGKITKVQVKRSRVLVYVELLEPILKAKNDGPFTLYDEANCKVELRFEVGRAAIKQSNIEAIEASFESVFKAFSSQQEAMAFSTYNQRVRDPYPEDYQQTLADYEAWKVEQELAAIERTIEQAFREINRISAGVKEETEYARGFVAGLREMKRQSLPDACDQLQSATPSRFMKTPKDRITAGYKEGFDDGQRLAFYQEQADRLTACLKASPH